MHPLARHAGLLVESVGDEVVVYDQMRDRAHTLNRAAAIVWRHCDGQTSTAQLAAAVALESGLPADEDVVELALHRLAKAQLLDERGGGSDAPVTRREVVRRLGLSTAAALLLPAVASMAAPTPADAQSASGCLGRGASCVPGNVIRDPEGRFVSEGGCCPGLGCGPSRFFPGATSVCEFPANL